MQFIQNKITEFKNMKRTSNLYKLGLISGFIDADGYVKHGEILLTQKNKNIIFNFIKICKTLDIPIRKVWSEKITKQKILYGEQGFQHLLSI